MIDENIVIKTFTKTCNEIFCNDSKIVSIFYKFVSIIREKWFNMNATQIENALQQLLSAEDYMYLSIYYSDAKHAYQLFAKDIRKVVETSFAKYLNEIKKAKID